jgi:hypothetical protein
MERRLSLRAQVDVPLAAHVDGFWHDCRLVELSTTGALLELTRRLASRDLLPLQAFEIRLGGRPVRTRGRIVWTGGRLSGVRFIGMHDVDRLTLAEHIDRRRLSGLH